GRIAMDMLASHLAHAGYYGTTIFPSTISNTASTTSPLAYTLTGSDCGANWVTNLTAPLLVNNDANPYSGTCIVNVTSGKNRWNWVTNTDVLELRNANPVQPATFTTGAIYVRGDLNNGILFLGGGTVPPLTDFAGSVETHEINA